MAIIERMPLAAAQATPDDLIVVDHLDSPALQTLATNGSGGFHGGHQRCAEVDGETSRHHGENHENRNNKPAHAPLLSKERSERMRQVFREQDENKQRILADRANRSEPVNPPDRRGFSPGSVAARRGSPSTPPPKPAPAPVLLPCDHRGEVIRQDVSNLCGTRGREVEIFACGLHGECSAGRYCRHQTVRACATCDDCTTRPLPVVESKPVRVKRGSFFNPPEPIRETPWPASIVRHCLYFVMPKRGNGVWQANIEQLRRRLDLFNGRRILAVVTGPDLDPPDDVAAALGGGFEVLTFPNDKRKRETVALLPMLEHIASTDPGECFWFGHAKGVSKAPIDAPGTTVHEWTRAMYAATLDDWPTIERLLTDRLFAGAFRRVGNFKEKGNHAWHYSGTFWWGRSARVFARDWRGVDPRWWGVESWPGRMCSLAESACIVCDNAGDLYKMGVWQEARKELEAWNAGRFAMS